MRATILELYYQKEAQLWISYIPDGGSAGVGGSGERVGGSGEGVGGPVDLPHSPAAVIYNSMNIVSIMTQQSINTKLVKKTTDAILLCT